MLRRCYVLADVITNFYLLQIATGITKCDYYYKLRQYSATIQSSINLGKTFPRISRIRIITSTQILARVFVYLPPFISQILDFICRMVLIFILIFLEWRETENQQLWVI